jgi:hypothetical protein
MLCFYLRASPLCSLSLPFAHSYPASALITAVSFSFLTFKLPFIIPQNVFEFSIENYSSFRTNSPSILIINIWVHKKTFPHNLQFYCSSGCFHEQYLSQNSPRRARNNHLFRYCIPFPLSLLLGTDQICLFLFFNNSPPGDIFSDQISNPIQEHSNNNSSYSEKDCKVQIHHVLPMRFRICFKICFCENVCDIQTKAQIDMIFRTYRHKNFLVSIINHFDDDL